VIDGYLARRNNWISELGKILDPLADKLMQFTVLIVFYFLGIIPIWFVIPFVLKDGITLLMGMLVIKKRNVVVVSKWYGKMAVFFFYLTIAISVIFEKALAEHSIIYVVIFMPAIIVAIAAFVGYLKHYSSLKNPESELSKSGKIQ
jgi:cardiolipin synthase